MSPSGKHLRIGSLAVVLIVALILILFVALQSQPSPIVQREPTRPREVAGESEEEEFVNLPLVYGQSIPTPRAPKPTSTPPTVRTMQPNQRPAWTPLPTAISATPTDGLPGPTTTGGEMPTPTATPLPPLGSGFGTEAGNFSGQVLTNRADELDGAWIRINNASWRSVQPEKDGPYHWEALRGLEEELTTASRLGMTPLVLIDDNPQWATILPASCSAIREEYFGHFALFMRAMVERYSAPPFNVHYWELMNEPDVDPSLVPADSIFGCWGNAQDEFYGGAHYGLMLQAVTPVIHDADPDAKVVVGGLLLQSPSALTTDATGSEHFFEGILYSGAAQYFDVVAYHSYGAYTRTPYDHSVSEGGYDWSGYGGPSIGKPTFLKSLMHVWGVDKPLFLDEMGILCNPHWSSQCSSPPEAFYQEQADYLPYAMIRAQSAGVSATMWYTLTGPGWYNGGLLDDAGQPRPAFRAYRTLIAQVAPHSGNPTEVSYGPQVETYRYVKATDVVDTVWSLDRSEDVVRVPVGKFIAAFSRDGEPLTPAINGEFADLSVPYSVVYIHRQP